MFDLNRLSWSVPQGGFPSGLDSVRGTRHHGLVERVHRDRNRINSPHRRPIDKHGRSPYGFSVKAPQVSLSFNSFNCNQIYPRVRIKLPYLTFPSLPSSIFPSPEQNPGLSHYQGSLNTGGSLPDLSNLHFPSPLSTPLDPEDIRGYPNLSGGSSTGNLPAAMMHLGIGNSQGGINNSPRRRPTPISPLTLSPGSDQRRGLAKQLSPTMSPSLSPITQLDHFSLLENAMSSTAGGSCFDPSTSSSLYCSQAAITGLGGSHGNLQDPLQMKSNMLYTNCSGGVPNIILTDDSNPSLSKDISSALSAVPECFDSEAGFPLEDELRIEPLSLDGLSMLSDPDMVLPDPSVEDTFRSDRL
uniref:CREB regulated transcription coactivator 3 n=1 Tax=Myripristis murdjan TaxID=586833 RepID=A0A668A9P1_9TELE